jgi:hypothetical protein
MRRTFALLALLATSWPHAAALECALASTPSVPGEASGHVHHGPGDAHATPSRGHEHGHEHGHARGHEPAHDHGPLSAGDGGGPTGARDCAKVMACGLVMIQSEREATARERVGGPDVGPFPAIDAPSTTVLTADPPPPRRNA